MLGWILKKRCKKIEIVLLLFIVSIGIYKQKMVKFLTPEHKAKLHAGLRAYHLKKKVITCSYVKRTLSDEHKAKLHAGLAAYNMKRKLMKENRNKNYKLAEILLDFKNKII